MLNVFYHSHLHQIKINEGGQVSLHQFHSNFLQLQKTLKVFWKIIYFMIADITYMACLNIANFTIFFFIYALFIIIKFATKHFNKFIQSRHYKIHFPFFIKVYLYEYKIYYKFYIFYLIL